jgi:hypothetical protein
MKRTLDAVSMTKSSDCKERLATARMPNSSQMDKPVPILSEILQFTRQHLVHFLIFAPGAFILVTVHESTHALVALARGGVIRDIHLLPTRQNWGGSISFNFPAGVPETSWNIWLAPYIVWLLLAVLTTGIAVRRPSKSYFAASCWFVWGFLMPLADLVNAALFWSRGAHNDFYDAFGQASLLGIFAAVTLIVLCMAWGAVVQRGLYSDNKLSWRAWWTMSCSALAGFIALNLVAFRSM